MWTALQFEMIFEAFGILEIENFPIIHDVHQACPRGDLLS